MFPTLHKLHKKTQQTVSVSLKTSQLPCCLWAQAHSSLLLMLICLINFLEQLGTVIYNSKSR